MPQLAQFPAPLNNPALLTIFLIWSLVWKGLALWYSARRGQTVWYVAMLILNTVGLLEIIYLIVYRRKKVNVQS
jgi:methionyl-tRNA synthetase